MFQPLSIFALILKEVMFYFFYPRYYFIYSFEILLFEASIFNKFYLYNPKGTSNKNYDKFIKMQYNNKTSMKVVHKNIIYQFEQVFKMVYDIL